MGKDGRRWIVVLVVIAAVAVVTVPAGWTLAPTATLLVVAAWSWGDDTGRSTVLAATCWAAVGFSSWVLSGLVWPIPQLLGLVAAAALLRRHCFAVPDWLGPGRSDRAARLLAVASVPITTLALVAFIASGRTDLDSATEGLQSLPPWTLPVAGLGFVLVNPTVEEILFRGLVQTMVVDVVGRSSVGIVAQAVGFGAIHIDGVPGGVLGVLMAAAWGVVLGTVRHRTDSIRVPWVVHALANLTIYVTVVTLAIEDGVI